MKMEDYEPEVTVESEIATVRAAIENKLHPTATYKTCKIPVAVTGILFEDFGHGQTGVAKNFLELHPLTQITFQ